MISLNYRDSRPIYEQIKDGLRKLIVTGAMKPDEKLPSVRALAQQLSINPNTIQRAYRELEVQGWVASEAGRGSFVLGIPESGENAALLKEFDKITARLLAAGVSRETLLQHLGKGGNDNA